MSTRRIQAVRTSDRQDVPAALAVPILSSADAWEGILVEQHRLPPSETPEISVPKHVVCVHLSSPMGLEWKTAGERFRSSRMVPGDINFTPADMPRTLRWQQEAELLLISVEPELIARVAYESVYADRIEFAERLGGADAQVQYIAMALKAELESGNLAGRLYGEALASALAVHVLRRYSTHERIIQDLAGGLPRQKLQKALEYINDNLDQDLSLARIAATVETSPYHFARKFKQTTGFALHQYVIDRKVKRAESLLARTDLPIVEVCFRVGFASVSHFTSLFGERTGLTPRAYRKANGPR